MISLVTEKVDAAMDALSMGLSIPAERLLFGTHSELQAPHQPSAQIGCLHPPVTPPAPQTSAFNTPAKVCHDLRSFTRTQTLLGSAGSTLRHCEAANLAEVQAVHSDWQACHVLFIQVH